MLAVPLLVIAKVCTSYTQYTTEVYVLLIVVVLLVAVLAASSFHETAAAACYDLLIWWSLKWLLSTKAYNSQICLFQSISSCVMVLTDLKFQGNFLWITLQHLVVKIPEMYSVYLSALTDKLVLGKTTKELRRSDSNVPRGKIKHSMWTHSSPMFAQMYPLVTKTKPIWIFLSSFSPS